MLNRAGQLFQKETQHGCIEVWQQNKLRWLSIDAIEQTRINIDHPGQLESPLHYAFLASLFFVEIPEKILLAGMGGGALARYLHHRRPVIKGDAVEISETIAVVAKRYFYFPETQWNIIVADIQQWQGAHSDLIVVDIAVADLTPAWLTSEKMLLHLKQQLSASGVLAMNLLVADAQSLSSMLMVIRRVFERRTLCLSIPDHKNIVVFAFNQQPRYRSISELNSRIGALTKIWGFDFNPFLERLIKDNPVGSGVF